MPFGIAQFRRTDLVVGLVLLLTVLTPGLSRAQVARVELHAFRSMTLTDEEFLTGRKDGVPVVVAGDLRLPTPGTDRLPAVVLLHGSGGVSGYVDDWAQQLNAMGVATFVIDSFTGRGIVSTTDDQGQLGRLAMIVDAYRALELLARHPRIDPARIALMGFSRGAQDALYASLKRFQRMHGPGNGLEFAAYIAFYPDCSTTYREDDAVAARPIRVFHGSADDYNPVAPCRAYVERLRRAGHDVELVEYAGAHHAFDWPVLEPPLKLAKAQTTRRCRLEEASGGHIINSDTKRPFDYSDPCVEYGPTVAYHAQAYAQAQQAVKEFLAGVFKHD